MTKIRESKGGACEIRGKFYARVTTAAQKRTPVLVPWATSLEEADARAKTLQVMVNRLRECGQLDFIEKVVKVGAPADSEKLEALARAVDGIVAGAIVKQPKAPSGTPTLRSVLKEWTSGALADRFPDYVTKKRSWRDDNSRAKHIADGVLDKPLTAWTLDTYETVMAALPRTLGPTTRRHVAQLLHRVFELAVFPLRYVHANPIPRLPRAKSERLLAALYPDDIRDVCACDGNDLGYRVLWAFDASQGWRVSEAIGRKEPKNESGEDESVPPLFWRDVDFDHAVARLARTKGTEAADVPLDVDTLEGLRAWKHVSPRTAPSDPVFVTMDGKRITERLAAHTFREQLQRAGITRETRADLFPEGAELKRRRRVRVHDVRGLFVTASLAQGKSDTWVRERTRHLTPGMLDVYRRNVPHFKQFGPLPTMLEAVPELAAAFAAIERGYSEKFAESAGELSAEDCTRFRRKDSNLDKRIQNPLSCH